MKPHPALLIGSNIHQIGELLPQLLDQIIRIFQAFRITGILKGHIANGTLINTLIKFFLEIQIVIIGHRHIIDNAVIRTAVIHQRKDQVNDNSKQGNDRTQHQCSDLIF